MREWLEIRDWTAELWLALWVAALLLTMIAVSGFGRFHER
jgi:hypothetical protein